MDIVVKALKKTRELFFVQTIVRSSITILLVAVGIIFYQTLDGGEKFTNYKAIIFWLVILINIYSTIKFFRKSIEYSTPEKNTLLQTLKNTPELVGTIQVMFENLGGGKYIYRVNVVRLTGELTDGQTHKMFIPENFLQPVLNYISSVLPKIKINYEKTPLRKKPLGF
jgi:hypothetical protein